MSFAQPSGGGGLFSNVNQQKPGTGLFSTNNTTQPGMGASQPGPFSQVQNQTQNKPGGLFSGQTMNTGMTNPGMGNQGMTNPGMTNQGLGNPGMTNLGMTNTGMTNNTMLGNNQNMMKPNTMGNPYGQQQGGGPGLFANTGFASGMMMSPQNELECVLDSYKKSYQENSMESRFQVPTYQYCSEMVHAAQQNQNNQICSNDPRYQYLWANSHKHNPNPQQYATTLLTGIDLVGKRQENFKLSLDGFTKDV